VSDFPEVDLIARLLALAGQYGVEELEVEEGELKVTLFADPEAPDAAAGSAQWAGSQAYLWQPPSWEEPDGPQRSDTAHALTAPLTGIFYRAESPDVPPLVEVGSTVEEGQAVGVVEAMKVFSRVEADCGGLVIEIAAANATLVQHGEVLLYIEPHPV
jgi:acetyl-CoA carboxylase biotin carboxyl carrier protein